MGNLDLDPLLFPVSDDEPAGRDLEYDPSFAELERAARGKPEQQMGDTIIPAEEPNWREVRDKALDLLSRSKDLRVAVHLARAALKLDGFGGFRDGLGLVRGLLERFWDSVYPRLDPDDDNDPTMRVNALAPLTDAEGTLRALRETPIVESRGVGRFTYRDFQLATGAVQAPPGRPCPEIAAIDAAFAEASLKDVQSTDQALAQSLEHLRAIESGLTDRVGSEQAADLSPLASLLRSIRQVLLERLSQRAEPASSAPPPEAHGETSPPAPGTARQPAANPGEIRTREDVIKTLDRVCDYYARHEPSSPVPLLLRRAQRLATKQFLDIIQDLAPSALSEIEKIRGVDN